MLSRSILLLSTLLLSGLVFAQQNKMSDPDILGLKLGMNKNEAIAQVKKNFPNSKINIVNKEIKIEGVQKSVSANFTRF